MKRDRVIYHIFMAVVFIVMFLFFTVVHPLYIFDSDDWTYIVASRKAFPLLGVWNPIKVLPETLMPLAAELGIRLFMPFSGDYIGAMALSFALLLSLAYTVYFHCFIRLFSDRFCLSCGGRLEFGALMILLHFLPYLNRLNGNEFMYIAADVTRIFNYTIPSLLNATLVLWLSHGNAIETIDLKSMVRKPRLRDGWILLFVYLAINSNIYQSIVLMAYIFSRLFFWYVDDVKRSERLKIKQTVCFVKEKIIWFSVILVWLVSLMMEASGGRADSLQYRGSYWLSLKNNVISFVKTTGELNHFFLAFAALILAGAFLVFFISRKNREEIDLDFRRNISIYALSFLVTMLYLVLLCARTGQAAIKGSAVYSGILFYLFLMIWISLNYMGKKSRSVVNLAPIVLYVLLFATLVNVRSYREININGLQAVTVKRISDDIVADVMEADQRGMTEMELHVPVFDMDNNWPIIASENFGGVKIAHAMYLHGMISREIKITVIPDEEKNGQYNLK